jgi:hypothetical protein
MSRALIGVDGHRQRRRRPDVTYYGHSEPIQVGSDGRNWLRALPYSLGSLLLGWWGLPWGPIRTVQALVVNFNGGESVTAARNRSVHGVEDPHAKWTCPSCGRSNSNISFNCSCGYRLV